MIEIPNEGVYLEDYVMDGGVILECILEEYDLVMRMVGFHGDCKEDEDIRGSGS